MRCLQFLIFSINLRQSNSLCPLCICQSRRNGGRNEGNWCTCCRRKAGTNPKQEPGRVSSMKPACWSGIPGNIPGSFSEACCHGKPRIDSPESTLQAIWSSYKAINCKCAMLEDQITTRRNQITVHGLPKSCTDEPCLWVPPWGMDNNFPLS